MKEGFFKEIPGHVNLLKNVELTSEDFKNFLLMDASTYEELLMWAATSLNKDDTIMRDAISPNERLSATLRFLATVQNFEHSKFFSHISSQALEISLLKHAQ